MRACQPRLHTAALRGRCCGDLLCHLHPGRLRAESFHQSRFRRGAHAGNSVRDQKGTDRPSIAMTKNTLQDFKVLQGVSLKSDQYMSSVFSYFLKYFFIYIKRSTPKNGKAAAISIPALNPTCSGDNDKVLPNVFAHSVRAILSTMIPNV